VLSIFKTNRIFIAILLIPYAFILRSYGFFRNTPTDFDNGGLLADWLYETIGLEDMILVSVSFILILLQALFLIGFTNRDKLSNDRNLYTGVFYILLASSNTYFLGLTPALMGNTFLLLALSNFFEIYKMKEPAGKHFNAGFWTAIATLFYGSYFVFFLFGIIAINLMRALNLKEMLQFVSGYVVPFFLLFTYYLYMGDVNDSYWPYLTSSFGIMDFRIEELNISALITVIIMGLFLLACIFKYGVFVDKQGMKTRKNTTSVFLFILFAIGSISIQSEAGMEHFIVVAIPLSILSSILFTRIKKTIWAETWHLLIFILIPLTHYLLV